MFIQNEVTVMTERCPWCGRAAEHNHHPTGSPFLAKCRSCGKYYGQNNHSKQMAIPFVLFFALLALSFIFSNIIPFVIGVITCLPYMFLNVFRLPYKKVQWTPPRGDVVFLPDSGERHIGKLSAVNFSDADFTKNAIYPQTKNFDNFPSYSQPSPVRVHSYDWKSKELVFTFLYTHEQNSRNLAGEPFTIVDNNDHVFVCTIIPQKNNCMTNENSDLSK